MAAPPAQSELGLKERFYRDFQLEVAATQEQIEHLGTITSVSERNQATEQCLAGIDRLSHQVKDASGYIPAYDQRTYSQSIKTLSERLQNIRNTFDPPKKFSFKSRKAAAVPKAESTSNPNPSPSTTTQPPKTITTTPSEIQELPESDNIPDGPGIQRPPLNHTTKTTISAHSNLHLILPSSATHATTTGTLSSISHSIIDISAPTTTSPFSALYLKNITSSLIICGRVAGAIHITGVHDSVILVATRQFRMHDSRDTDVYLHCASRPIIEDCGGVRFAELDGGVFGEKGADGGEMGEVVNRWNQIDDFKWLKAGVSPNFGVLKDGEGLGREELRKLVGWEGALDEGLKVMRKG